MILLELKRYIQQHQQVSLQDIQAHFDLSEEAALGLLAPLQQQGHVLTLNTPHACTSKTCHTGCAQPENIQSFLWSDSVKKPVTIPIQLK